MKKISMKHLQQIMFNQISDRGVDDMSYSRQMTYKSANDVWMSSAHGTDDMWTTFGCHPHMVRMMCG